MRLIDPDTIGLGSSSDTAFAHLPNDDIGSRLGNGVVALFGQPDSAVPAYVGPAAPAAGGSYSSIVAFGDSLSDDGNLYAASLGRIPAAPYAGGHFSNGATWVEDLAGRLGVPAPGPAVNGGNDFAYGGAETGGDPLHQASPIDLPSQFAQYLTGHLGADASALYTVSVGANDVLDAISANASSPASAHADIAQAVANEAQFVSDAASAGARNFLVLNVPDIGKTPWATARGPAVAATASALSAQYDQDLKMSLDSVATQNHVNVHIVDAYAFLDQGAADPAAFGLADVSHPVWSGNYSDPTSGTLRATGAAQNSYLFFDQLHPTAAGHALLASQAAASLATV